MSGWAFGSLAVGAALFATAIVLVVRRKRPPARVAALGGVGFALLSWGGIVLVTGGRLSGPFTALLSVLAGLAAAESTWMLASMFPRERPRGDRGG